MITIGRRHTLLGAAAMTVPAARPSAARADNDSIDRLLRQPVEAGRIAGIVALAATDKAPIYEGAFGKRGPAPDAAAMTPDSVFWIASMTKAITSTAAMQLVERGKLALDRPISDILPELASVQVLEGFDPAGAPKLRPAKRPITLRHLLTHTAGFTYDIWDADTARYRKRLGVPGLGSGKNAALDTPLAFDPGERWEYGINIDWAGKAIERVVGQTLGVYFREHLFGPLGMIDTTFRLRPDQRGRAVSAATRQPDGTLAPIPFQASEDQEFESGGGGLHSTALDYMLFCQIFLHEGRAANGTQILRPETVALMVQNQMGDIDVVRLHSIDPTSSRDVEFFPGMVKKWSTAFMINTRDVPTGRAAGSLAWAGLFNTYFWIDPTRRVAGVILMQLLPFLDEAALDTFTQFETATYAAARPT